MNGASWYFNRVIVFSIAVFGLWACTEADPQLEILGGLGYPTFNGKTDLTVIVGRVDGVTPIQGACDQRSQSLEASADGGREYSDFKQFCDTSSLNCAASKSFTCQLQISKLGFQVGVGGEKKLLLRGFAEKERSKDSSITILYRPSNSRVRTSLFSGEVQSSGSSYRMKLRVSPREVASEGSQFGIAAPDAN